MKSISIVIPNYNGRHLLEQNLPSIYSALKTSNIADYEFIISDDNSVDNSCDYLKNNYPDILLIEGGQNIGFGGNMNRGIYKASKELIFLLNSDVTLTDGYFICCMPYFEDASTFGVMGSISSPNGDSQDGAKYPEIVGLKIKGTFNYKFKKSRDKWIPTFFLSGANALVDRKKIVRLGGFDEIYNPYYAEDVDLSLRAWRHGYHCYFDNKPQCIHPISRTISKEKKDKVDVIRRRNRFFIHHIQLGPWQLLLWWINHIVKLIPKTLLLDFNYLKSFKLFLLSLKRVRRSRLKVKNEAELSLADVKKKIIAMIGNGEIIKFRV